MSVIHFLNVLEGDCNIIEHDSGRVTVIDVSNASNDSDTPAELLIRRSALRSEMFSRTHVPSERKNYNQKAYPDNPIAYMKDKGISNIFRFIVTHPDMDHLDGIKDLHDEFTIANFWDTSNSKEMSDKASSGAYNNEDWEFYKSLRDGKKKIGKRLTFHSGDNHQYYNEDNIHILSPTREIVKQCNESENWNDLSYVLLYTPPKANRDTWKILFAGDSEDITWEHILKEHSDKIRNIDVLFAPHHGRDSGRDYEFLKILNPKFTLFGNASSKHLAYSKYPKYRITNNQAGHVILDISQYGIEILVKNQEFAQDFLDRNLFSLTSHWSSRHKAYSVIRFS